MSTHPSEDIRGTKNNELGGKKIILCVTGSVAAKESPEIARELIRHGAVVRVVMSHASLELIHPNLMEWASGNPVVSELSGKLEHIDLADNQRSDLLVIAPTTANTISKIACGIEDTAVTTVASVAFGSKIPIIMVPAMHGSMYQNPVVEENVKKLKALGVQFVGPRLVEGKAKIADVQRIVECAVERFKASKEMVDMNVLVTSGPTVEHIDPVRVITNKSSGRMGIAVAEEALNRGANVTLISGPGNASTSRALRMINVETTEQMYEAVTLELNKAKYNLLVAAAAPADYTPEGTAKEKIRTQDLSVLTINLKRTPKIIDSVKKLSPQTLLVAFKAEHGLSNGQLVDRAYTTLKASNADLIVANDVARKGVGFGVETNEVFIINRKRQVTHLPLASKTEVAKRILDIATYQIRSQP